MRFVRLRSGTLPDIGVGGDRSVPHGCGTGGPRSTPVAMGGPTVRPCPAAILPSGGSAGPGQRYPRATSSTIITVKPPMAPIVARSVLSWRCDSGMSSSTTT